MGKIYPVVIIIWLSASFHYCRGQNLTVMTYNIRYDNPADGENNWHRRKGAMVKLLRHYQPEIFGIQEGLLHQVQYLDSGLINYTYTGVGREDGKTKGEFSAIFYDSTRFLLIKGSTFWLSENSGKISIGWDAALERICTYGLFEHKDNQRKVWIFNTHYDHVGVKARENSSTLIIKKIKELNTNNFPVILMGDFNSEPDSKPITIISKVLRNEFDISNGGPLGTFNGFDPDSKVDRRIDYIFISQGKVLAYTHVNDKMDNGNCISDHLPVLMRLHLDPLEQK